MLMRNRTSWLRRRCSLHATASARFFRSLGLDDVLVERLFVMGISEPTAAQREAIPLILSRQDVVIGAETGGGKTLAYLLPLLQQLQLHPLHTELEMIHRPVGLVMTTSQELVQQIARVLSHLDPELAKHVVCLSSNNQSLRYHRTAPIVIATPRALLRASQPKDFAYTETIVVDEADMLLGSGFEKDTKQIIATIRNQPLLRAQLNRWQPESSHAERLPEQEEEADDWIDPSEIAQATRQTIFSAISLSTLSLCCLLLSVTLSL